MIDEHLDDIQHEAKTIRHVKRRCEKAIEELLEMRDAWERRLPVVEKELDEMTEEDIERGWGEAFEGEYDMISESLPMSAEDLLVRRCQERDLRKPAAEPRSRNRRA